MATKNTEYISPGVFTREYDYSGLAQGIANIGGAVVAPFADGPAFFPTVVTSPSDLEEKFGIADGTYYGPYTAMEYLKQQGKVTVVRVGGLTGYWQKDPLVLYADPGVWLRNNDVAELYNTSFMYVNSEDYLSNISYEHDSEPCTILCDTGSYTDDKIVPYNPDGTVNDLYFKHGIYATGRKLEGEDDKKDITAFINTVSASIGNTDCDSTLMVGVTPEIYNEVSKSLWNSYNSGTLFTLTTKEAFTAFTYCNSEDYINSGSVASHGTGKKTDMAGYEIAWFDAGKFSLHGDIYCTGVSQISESFGKLTQSICTIVPTANINNEAASGAQDIIYKANVVSDSECVFKFVTVENLPDSDTMIVEGLSTYTQFTSSAWNNTTANMRFDTSYIKEITGQINAAFGNDQNTAEYVCDYNGEDYISGSLRGGINYAGKNLNIGTVSVKYLCRGKVIRTFNDGFETSVTESIDINDVITSSNYSQSFDGAVNGIFWMSSSYQGTICTNESAVAGSFSESTPAKPLFSTSMINPTVADTNAQACTPDTESKVIEFKNDPDYFELIGDANFSNLSFTARRGTGTCAVTLGLTGIISGSFGGYNGDFKPDNEYEIDPCNPDLTPRQPMILAVLANTLNGSTQWNSEKLEVYGFNKSVLEQNVSTESAYFGDLNPNENSYSLKLRYSYVDDNENTQEGTYGTYNFSLDEGDNNYIKNVFGTDPKVGDPEKQVYGQKVEAAYNYLLFEDSIKKFIAEKTLSNTATGTRGWKLMATTGDKFSIGEPLRFTDNYSTDLNSGDSEFAITNAYTPWIYSQRISPFQGTADISAKPTKYKLFRIHTISDGTLSNQKYKIEISNVKLAGTVPGSNYGSFTLAVRKFSDTDKRPKYLEIFQNLNLDPDSSNFIARRIGDYYAYITFSGKIIEFGTYENLSKYIRIEMTENIYPESVVPYGFEAYNSPIGNSAAKYVPVVKYSKASIYSLGIGKYPSGTVFGNSAEASDELASLYPNTTIGAGVNNDTLQYFKPLPAYGEFDANGSNIDFDLEDPVYGTDNGINYANYYAQGENTDVSEALNPELSGSIPSTYDSVNESKYVKMRKFVVGFQGGFDGQWPAIPINLGSDITPGNTQGFDCTNIKSAGSIAYKQCISAIGNADEFDINLVVTPGLFYQHHPYVCGLVIDTCENRGDCFYVMDNIVFPKSNQSVDLIDAAVSCVATLDTNYAATYYPWVKILDTNLNKIIAVPPSVVIPSIYAQSDKTAGCEWYCPAGLNRGGISQAVQVLDRLTQADRDVLYEGRVNPIAAFPGQGIVVWGQKTLQQSASALDRINVRRLLISVKKYISSLSRYLIFEQNVAATRNKFLSIVNPYMESIQQRNGFYAFKVVMDETNNTDDVIDQNILRGNIMIKPVKAIEFVVLDFSVYSTGASFEEH